MLDVKSYGMYREFVLYSLVAARIMISGIPPNLLYFLPKDPAKESAYVVNTFIFTFITTSAGIVLILLSRNWLVGRVSFDFINLMVCYIFLFVNLDFIESYWLAKKRSDYVFAYSTTLPILRMGIVISAAYISHDVGTIIVSMVLFEGIKFIGLILWWYRRLGLSVLFDRNAAIQQLRFIIPLGSGVLLATLNQQFGSLFVANIFGPVALAIYTIGLYQIPVISIVRSAISDVIFPEMVKKNQNTPEAALSLWRRANNIFCFVVFPVFAVFWVYAQDFITLLFTKDYEAAVPIFQVMLILMLLQCFEFGTPLRSRNQNRYFLRGNMLAIVANIVITVALYNQLGIVAPAVAFLFSELVKSVYLAYIIAIVYSCRISGLFMWRNIFRIGMASVAGVPLLLIGVYLNTVLATTLAIVGYGVIYYALIRYLHIEEVELIIRKFSRKVGWKV